MPKNAVALLCSTQASTNGLLTECSLVHGDATVFLAVFPVLVNNLVFLENRKQMVGIFFAYILYAKIVHNEGKADGAPLLGPETGCLVVLCVLVKFQPFFQKILG